MKKIASLFLAGVALVAAVQLSSCKKDKKNENSLVGTWMSTSIQSKSWENNVLVEDTTEAIAADELLVTLNSDNTYKVVQKGEPDEFGTYKAEGGKLIITESGSTDSDTSNYSVSGNTMKLYESGSETFGGVEYRWEFSNNFTRK